MEKKLGRYMFRVGALLGLVLASLALPAPSADAADGEFYLQVSPSPLVVTLKPGQTTSYDLKIRNAGSAPERLKIAPRTFTLGSGVDDVTFDDTKIPPEIGDWTKFSNSSFTVQPGEWFTEKVTFAVPKEAGFSYSFALVITRQDDVKSAEGRQLKGTVAVFALVNIDKPGASRTLELEKLSTDNGIYEYLPVKINVQLKNTGNSIVRPNGNVFVQRSSNDESPIATLLANEKEGYILPGTSRTLSVNWTDGYPAANVVNDGSGKEHADLDWNFAHLSSLRIGYYTVKLVAIYNDGQRDIPVVGEVGFWVIPWKLLLGGVVIVGVLGAGLWSIVGKLTGRSKRGRRHKVKFQR